MRPFRGSRHAPVTPVIGAVGGAGIAPPAARMRLRKEFSISLFRRVFSTDQTLFHYFL
jgi:hypothetical protein